MTVLKWTLAEAPRQEIAVDALLATTALEIVLPSISPRDGGTRAFGVPPVSRPPLFVLNSSYRC